MIFHVSVHARHLRHVSLEHQRVAGGFIREVSRLGQQTVMKYELNEKVLVYQGPLLYDAKIAKTYDPLIQKISYYDEKKKEVITTSPDKKFPDKYLSEVVYRVHYNGWNVKWDEWVDLARMMPDTKENRTLKEEIEYSVQEAERVKQEEERQKEEEKEKEKEKAKRLKAKMKGKGKSVKVEGLINGNGGLNGVTANLDDSSRGKRGRKKGSTDMNDGDDSKRKKVGDINILAQYDTKNGLKHGQILLEVPDELKIILVDDWEMITKNNKLVIVPSSHSVNDVLSEFSGFLAREFNDDEVELSILLEMTESIRLYFDQCVGTFVIYRYERPQYNDLLAQGVSNFGDLYGPIFLLRMLTIFPSILALNKVDASTMKISKAYLDIILHWLNTHKEEYLSIEYENQSPWISVMHG